MAPRILSAIISWDLLFVLTNENKKYLGYELAIKTRGCQVNLSSLRCVYINLGRILEE
jgi:hypothetical protein